MAADLITRIPQRAARWSAEHPWRAILTWLVLVVAATSLAVLVPTQQAEEADYRIGQSGRADAMAEQAGLSAPPGEVVLLSPACASFDQFRDYETRGEAFRKIVASLTGQSDENPCEVVARSAA